MNALRFSLLLALAGCLPAQFAPAPPDEDGDGFSVLDGDCDDTNALVHPDTAWYADEDGDAYGDPDASVVQCEAPAGHVLSGTDCDDGDADIRPEAAETCDGVDEDCDGTADEGAPGSDAYYLDTDEDGYGDDVNDVLYACEPIADRVTQGGDCDDDDKTSFPGGTEVCDDADNDCDDAVDDDPTDGDPWYVDGDDDGFGGDTVATFCDDPGAGYAATSGDCDDADDKIGDTLVWFEDLDGDGYGNDAVTVEQCEAPAQHVAAGGDCNDDADAIHPGVDETCDGVDEDCDGSTDEDAIDPTTWYLDGDGDGFGAGTGTDACAAPADHVDQDGDCKDDDDAFYPGAPESCSEAVDYNCDGNTGFADGDNDGSPACEDCDDANPNAKPGGTEVCDGSNVDEDCDELADDADSGVADATRTDWYLDDDGDGYGVQSTKQRLCDAPADHVSRSDLFDCDDGALAINPGAAEVCDLNDTDEDCDGAADDLDTSPSGRTAYYADVDGDTHGDAADEQLKCEPVAGRVLTKDDCDDTNGDKYPSAPELCDGLENDCTPGWALADEDGHVSHFPATGNGADLTAAWAAGVLGAPAAITLPSNGTVAVCPGTYYVNVTSAATGSITLEGADEATTFLNGDGKGRVVAIEPGVGATITDLTLVDGAGGVRVNGSASLARVTIADNTAATGGGLHATATSGVVTLDACTLTGNHATGLGGGVQATGGVRVTLTNGTVVASNLSDTNGGGVALGDGSALACTDSAVAGNTATGVGGAVYVNGVLDVTSATCDWGVPTVDDNTPDDLVLEGTGVIGTYESDASFTCSGTGCN